MHTVTLLRPPAGTPDVDGTFGQWMVDDGSMLFVSGELPDRGNQRGISCIPCGVYQCRIIESPKHGRVYEVQNVPGRSNIEIHSASYCGDVSRGKKSDLLGCICIGDRVVVAADQRIVTGSKDAMAEFMEYMGGEPFILTIKQR